MASLAVVDCYLITQSHIGFLISYSISFLLELQWFRRGGGLSQTSMSFLRDSLA